MSQLLEEQSAPCNLRNAGSSSLDIELDMYYINQDNSYILIGQ